MINIVKINIITKGTGDTVVLYTDLVDGYWKPPRQVIIEIPCDAFQGDKYVLKNFPNIKNIAYYER